MNESELVHYGIKGMKWGVRRSPKQLGHETAKDSKKEKLHLGLDKHGNLTITRDKTTKEAKIAFAVRSAMFIASIALTAYVSTHPKAVENGKKRVDAILKNSKNLADATKPVSSGIFSKALGRELTIAEALDLGLDLRD